MGREDSGRIGTVRIVEDEPAPPPPPVDEGKVAHAWITRVAAIVGTVSAIAALGFSAATFLGRFASQEDLASLRTSSSEHERQAQLTFQAHDAELAQLRATQVSIAQQQRDLNAKIDWLIQVQLLTASRSRVSLPAPPQPRYAPEP